VLKKVVTEDWLKSIGKEKIQALQDSFAALFNISLCLFSTDGKGQTVWSNSSLFCHYMFTNHRSRCLQERRKAIDYILNKGQIGIFNCYMGLTFFCAPLMVDGKIKGIFYGGGFCSEDNKKAFKGGTIYDIPIIETKKIQELANFMGILIDLLDHKINNEEKKEPDKFKNIIFLQKKLSPREIDIVKLITEGLSNKEIASQLNISDKTVKTHVSNILRKLEMKDRTQVIIFCQQIS